jgi:hypothetical protein
VDDAVPRIMSNPQLTSYTAAMDFTFDVGDSGWWFALALVNAGLAENKGRGRWNWFLLSLVLGPFATL